MRNTVWGGALGAGVVLLVWAVTMVEPVAWGQRPVAGTANLPERYAPSGELIALSFDAGSGRQHITLVDPRTQMMGVYAVDPASGALALKSVRNIRWDLQMDEFNGTEPSPREIRSLLGNR